MRTLKVLSISILLITISNFAIGQATISQKSDISIVSVNVPDTVQIGETITIDGFIKNDGLQIINQDLLIVYDIEDVEPEDYEEDDETDEEDIFEIGQLLPGDSIPFSKNMLINAARFIPNSHDVVIIWPETFGQRVGSNATNYNVNQTYVMEASEDTVNDLEEEDDDSEEDSEEDNNNSNKIGYDTSDMDNEFKMDKSYFKKQTSRLYNISNDKPVHLIQENNILKLKIINPTEIEIISFMLYDYNGQLIYSGNTKQYQLKANNKTHLMFGIINYRSKTNINIVKTIAKTMAVL